MDELRMIRELLPERETPAQSVEQARTRLDELVGQTRPHRPRRTRNLAIGLTAAAAAVAVTAVAIPVLSGSGEETGRPGTSHVPRPVDALSAKDVLLLAAQRAEKSVASSGKYWHVRTVGGNTDTVVGTGANRYHLERRWVSETWTPRGEPATLWDGYRELGYRPATAADKAAWVRDGSPSQWDLGPGDTVGGEHLIVSMAPEDGHLGKIPLDSDEQIGPAEAMKLPTDPAALKKYLLGIHNGIEDAGDPNRWLFSWASGLLVDLPAPPAVRAAVLRIIAELPGVHSQGEVRDPLGRDGVGIVLVGKGDGETFTEQLVVDPDTGRLLALVIGGPSEAKAKNGYQAVLDAGWTNEKPHVPSADIG
jgi:hypothetical protein